MRFWLGLAALSSFFAVTPALKAEAPVITGPTNLFQLDTNEAFDPTLNNGEGAWTQKAEMPTPRSHLVVCEVNNIIYAIGGYTGAGSPTETALTLNVEAYNPATDAWTTKTPMPEGRGQPACGAIDGIVYVAGGYDDTTAGTATLYAFGPAANGGMGSWTQKHDMPQTSYGAASGVIDGKLYVVGVCCGHSGGSTVMYDPATDSWETRTDMPTPRGALGAAVVNDILYAISGGISNDLPNSVKVEAYDPVTDQWTTKTDIPTGRDQFGIGVFNNIIYAVGGQGIRVPIDYLFNDVEAFDPAANGGMGSWTQKTPMPTSRAGFSAQFVDGILYAIGGTILGTAVVGQPFIYQVTATNNPTSYTFDPPGVNNPFPPGLTLDPTSGLLYGVPTTAGKYRIHLHATNASGTGNSTFDIGVFPAPTAGGLAAPTAGGLTVVSSTSTTGRNGQTFSFQALATGGSAATHFSFGNLPHGLNGNAVTGLISGTPTSVGNFIVAVTAIDGASEATGTLQLTFISDATVPIITSAESAILTPGQFFSYTITADQIGTFVYIGDDGIKHQGMSSAGLPAGLSFDGDHTISGCFNPPCGPAPPPPQPDTITIRPPLRSICQPVGNNVNGTGTRPLNFFAGYTITVSASPVTAGTVSGLYNQNSTVTVRATPNNCSNFVNWTENGQVQSTSQDYTFTPTYARTLLAHFVQTSYKIRVVTSSGGTASGRGNYVCGSTVTVLATPDSCHNFANWTDKDGSVASTSASYSFTASTNRELTAHFAQISCKIRVLTSSGGTTSGQGNYVCGSTATVLATPDSCHNFANWTNKDGSVASTSASYSFTVSTNRELTAHFTQTCP